MINPFKRIATALFQVKAGIDSAVNKSLLESAFNKIEQLEAELKAVHESRSAWLEYAQKIESGEYVLMPKEPTEAMYGGFARDLVRYLEINERWSPLTLAKYLDRFYGGTAPTWRTKKIPSWLSKEIPDFSSDHHFAKGDIAAFIYKAMIEALEKEDA